VSGKRAHYTLRFGVGIPEVRTGGNFLQANDFLFPSRNVKDAPMPWKFWFVNLSTYQRIPAYVDTTLGENPLF